MSLHNRVVLPLAALLSLSFLVACSSSSNKATPPPNGKFSNTNLNGTYVFSTSGQDTSGVFIAIAGTFNACGCTAGTISTGTMDVNDPLLGMLLGVPITGGTYSVGVDGRPASSNGLLTLQTASGTFTFDFVLTSSEHGLITLYDVNNGTGSGTLDLQSTVTQSNINGQSFTFNFNGVGNFNSGTGAQTSYSTIGAFALDASGQVGVTTSGVADINNDGIAGCNQTTGCSITAGFVSLGTVPGTASLTIDGVHNFHVYPVDATHMKFIEIDALPVIAGDVFVESSSIPTGNNVFNVAGYDTAVPGPFTAAGIIDTDGSGNVKSDSVEDINDAGLAIEVGSITGGTAIGGSYTAVSGGRSVLTLTGFVNGGNGAACISCQFAAYPSNGGLQLLEIDSAGVTGGIAYAQGSSPTLAASQGYGMNLSGFNSVEEDDIAEFVNNSGTLTGLIDLNDIGATAFDQTFSSGYTADSTVTGRGVVTPGSNSSFNLVTYGVDASTAVFVETDSGQVGLGSLASQNASAKSNAAAQHLTVLRLTAGAKNALKRR